MKKETLFVCQNCGHATGKWLGKCPECGEWNSLVEGRAVAPARGSASRSARAAKPVPLREVEAEHVARITTGIAELDRVLGGGMVPGAVVLLAGEPGVGKSTLLLEVAARSARSGQRTLYVSGEESAAQVRLRAGRTDALLVDRLRGDGNVLRDAEPLGVPKPAIPGAEWRGAGCSMSGSSASRIDSTGA